MLEETIAHVEHRGMEASTVAVPAVAAGRAACCADSCAPPHHIHLSRPTGVITGNYYKK